jgi:DNA polymerase III delta prime subunit
MIPILLVSKDQKKIKNYIKKFKEDNKISDNCVFIITPENKEISINQIKDIKKNLIYAVREPRLFILKDFDKSSYEAQNAFLKTLEEHHSLIYFLLVVSQYNHLTPTVISRSKVVIENDQIDILEKNIEIELKNFIKNKNLKILGNKNFQTKYRKNPAEIFDGFIYFFKKNISENKIFTDILKETLIYRYYVLNNNITPQSAIDHLIIYSYLLLNKKQSTDSLTG